MNGKERGLRNKTMIKDQQYWKDYNQKRKEYFRQKQREHRAKLKALVVDSSAVVDKIEVVDNSENKSAMSTTDQSKVLEVVDRPKEKVADTTQPQLWSNYYHCKKPFCSDCIKKGISADQYAFCSLAKATDPDFPNLYFCQVFHWTVYQGQGKT
jgi:hypothetical protein